MINILTILIALSVAASITYYWLFAQNKWLKLAYWGTIFNGLLCVYINWILSAPGRVPVVTLTDGLSVTLTSDTQATNLFSVLCLWMLISGVRGLYRLQREKGDQHV